MNNNNKLYDIVSRNVNLDGYTNSKGFLGYFESKQEHGLEESKSTARILLEDKYFGLPILVHNIYLEYGYNSSNPNMCQQSDINKARLLDRILGKKMVYEVSEQENCSRRISSFAPEDMSIAMPVADVQDLMTGMMAIDGLKGHCFGVYPQTGLVIYPHEDIGFGFISSSAERGYLQEIQLHLRRNYANLYKVSIWVDGKRPNKDVNKKH